MKKKAKIRKKPKKRPVSALPARIEKRGEAVPGAGALMGTASLNEPMALGDVFMKSGLFKDVKTKAQAVVKILAGRELGLAPIESMINIYMTPNGQIGLQAKIIGSLIKKSGKYDYTVDKLDNEGCTITFYILDYTGEGKRIELGKSTFTKRDAALAGIINKDNWKNYPRNMMFARALSNGAKWYTPDAFCGYTAEELGVDPAGKAPGQAIQTVIIDGKGKVKNGA